MFRHIRKSFLYKLIRNFSREDIVIDEDEEDDVEETDYTPRMLATRTVFALLVLAAVIWVINYQQTHQYYGFDFVCNEEVCQTNQYGLSHNIISTQTVDISNIERFVVQYDKIPNMSGTAPRIYAEYKDGSKALFSPVYIGGNVRYLYNECINPLNTALKKNPHKINFRFP